MALRGVGGVTNKSCKTGSHIIKKDNNQKMLKARYFEGLKLALWPVLGTWTSPLPTGHSSPHCIPIDRFSLRCLFMITSLKEFLTGKHSHSHGHADARRQQRHTSSLASKLLFGNKTAWNSSYSSVCSSLSRSEYSWNFGIFRVK